MTTPQPPSQAQTAAEVLESAGEAEMLLYLLNQQTTSLDRWPLPDGSAVIRHPDTGYYEFVSRDGSSEIQETVTQPIMSFFKTGVIIRTLLKQAATEAGARKAAIDDPPLSAVDALSMCPELNDLIYQALGEYEPDDGAIRWMDHEAGRIATAVRRRITRDQWQAIVTTTRERLRRVP